MRRKIDGVRESVQEAQQEGSQSASAAKAKLSSLRAAMGGGVKAYGKLKEDYKGAGTFSSPAAETGAAMFDVLQSLPALREFTEIFGSGVDDVLMVSYLAKLSRTQLSIAEQIEKI